MRRTWLTGLLTGAVAGGAVLAVSQGLHAQSSGTPLTGRIACVNVVNVFNEFQRQKDLTEELAAFQEKVNAEDATRKQKIDAEQATMDAMNVDEPTRVERMRNLLAMQIDYKNWRDLKKADMTREIGLWFTRIYQEILKGTEQIALKNGYDIVLYRGAFEPVSMDPEVIKDQIRTNHLLYAADATDVTQAVLDKLNADYRAQPRVKMLYSPD
jgi:Skp family chaperone for outer membrane proteins